MIGIKNFDMPDSCYDCPMCYDFQECVVSDIKFTGKYKTQIKFDFCNERHPECPLCETYEICKNVYAFYIKDKNMGDMK